MRKIVFTLLLSVTGISSFAQAESCYAVMDRDTLRLGNNLIERSFVWNDGALETASLSGKEDGFVFRTQDLRPDFHIGTGKLSAGRMEQFRIPAGSRHPSCLQVNVYYTKEDLELRREYRLYDGVPAISCDTWVRGILNVRPGDDEIILDQLHFKGAHWHGKAVAFRDVTDWNNTLVQEEDFIAFRKLSYKGNLLFVRDGISGNGFFFVKEAPHSDMQLGNHSGDFTAEFGHFRVTGAGILPEDVDKEGWTRLYGCVTGVFGKGDISALTALRKWQKAVRRQEDMVMMNTWGDRSQDARVDEEFCLRELNLAARLGISVFQIDDGWQQGKSPNSKLARGSFNNIWDDPNYWSPDPVKFPRGLSALADRAGEIDIELGLWFNPSVQDDFADWKKDADALIGLYRQYGIRIFKIDGLQIPTKKAERNLRRLFDHVREATEDAVVFNIDLTAGRRTGYHYFGEYGNIFLENRYTDWGNYYPYQTLRNLWMLSRYVPAERIQIEFLNCWRNADKYPAGDPFAPANYDFEYLAATTFAGQPLAWMEASNLPEDALSTGELIRRYRKIAPAFHNGTVLPIGEEPSGRSWTGFQSLTSEDEGFILLFREDTASNKEYVKTWLPAGARVNLKHEFGGGRNTFAKVSSDGSIKLKLNKKNSFALYKYKIKKHQ